MAVSPVHPGVEPPAVYQDDSISVYSFAVTPTTLSSTDSAVEEVMAVDSDSALKRKREASPDQPSKRPLPTHETPPPAAGTSTSAVLMDRFRADPNFNSSALTGDEAQTWRQLVVDNMFTWTEPPPPPKQDSKKGKKGKGKGKGKDVATEPDDPPVASSSGPPIDLPPPSYTPSSELVHAAPPVDSPATGALPQAPHWVSEDATNDAPKTNGGGWRRGKPFNPASSYKQLPTFTASAPRPRLAYIVVGPRVRGKFDVKRAEELGVQGRNRGMLSKGQAVRFMVNDGHGGKVERVVQPEECIGESEKPGVSSWSESARESGSDSFARSASYWTSRRRHTLIHSRRRSRRRMPNFTPRQRKT